ncbi:hypothetical protein G1H11_11625 [Phytoactinopolyspora alkaliphila]|uniref:Peptide chain release factor 1 n=1 Tax=Phytoactinopolyspora alkaliphila TaxID=1783498 RepID=A0A6N9YM77_9ACTN|nr:Vms1/Ankzf1 family peptidyl-tRNA hydrolase [Phytoactinopolyspora alkaliphila]NED95959.1 hypothetical protein [Phytoactinopolyspora alkaliphila]
MIQQQSNSITSTVSVICSRPGPFLSVYIDVSRDVDEAEHRIGVRWRSAREELHRAGAPASLLDLVGERVLDPSGAGGRVARMVVAADDEILLDEVTLRPRAQEALTWGPLPDVTGWLSDRSTTMPVLVVLADREGADFELYDAWPEPPVVTDSFHGDDLHVKKVAVGGWAHKQYQRRSEWTWRRNAEEVAAEIDRHVDDGVPLVVVAGDLRAQGEIRHAVSEKAREILVELETGGRAAGSSRDALDQAIDHAVGDVVVTDRLRTLNELEEQAGRGGAAAVGLREVLGKLTLGQVRTVLLSPDEASTQIVATRDYPGLPLPTEAQNSDELRADLAVVCAAAATDAEVAIVPRAKSGDGVSAVLRWDDQRSGSAVTGELE